MSSGAMRTAPKYELLSAVKKPFLFQFVMELNYRNEVELHKVTVDCLLGPTA